MSVLRLLGGGKKGESSQVRSASRAREAAVSVTPTIQISVPGYGAIHMNGSSSTVDEVVAGISQQPREDVVFGGEISVTLPPGCEIMRCKAVRVVFTTDTRLDIGPGRMGEEDVIFERKIEILPDGPEGIVLYGPVSRFEFTMILPSDLAVHDWHTRGKVRHNLWVELEGWQKPDDKVPRSRASIALPSMPHRRSGGESPFRGRSRSRVPSRASSPPGSRRGSRASSPAPAAIEEALAASTAAMSLNGDAYGRPGFPKSPSYEYPDHEWLLENIKEKRIIMNIYNPRPAGEVSSLDERTAGHTDKLGVYDFRMSTDVWGVCAAMRFKALISNIDPRITVFSIRVVLAQRATFLSPRDTDENRKEIVTNRVFPIVEFGKRPPGQFHHPDAHVPAIWRGTQAGGKDVADIDLDSTGRLPNDDHGRPSTLPHVKTPIRVSHQLNIECFFSVYGETDTGKPMTPVGAGGLRLLRVTRGTILPSCALTPDNLSLPSYETSVQQLGKTTPCPMCGVDYAHRYCKTCPPTMFPHVRHDHDPKRVGDPRGICPLCEQNGVVGLSSGTPSWRMCACGQSLQDMERRMKHAALAEQEYHAHQETENALKAEAERGRPR